MKKVGHLAAKGHISSEHFIETKPELKGEKSADIVQEKLWLQKME